MEQASYEVVGDFPVQSCDGTDVRRPGAVLLCQSNDCNVHSQFTNIRALVQGGHVKPIEKAAKPASGSASKAGGDA